jgi:hypothetical protein
MGKLMAVILMTGSLLPVPARAGQDVQAATHATRGVVQSIDSTTLIVSRPRNRGDIAFKLSPATHREGTIVVGSTVSVRYREAGKDHVATAIALQKP